MCYSASYAFAKAIALHCHSSHQIMALRLWYAWSLGVYFMVEQPISSADALLIDL